MSENGEELTYEQLLEENRRLREQNESFEDRITAL